MQLVHCGITWLLWSIDDGLIPRQLLFEILARVTVVRHRHVWIKSHLWTVLFQALSSSSWTIIVHESIPLFARHIKLLDLRKKLLQEHERLGLIRNYSESHFEDISIEDVKAMLTMHGEAFEPNSSEPLLRQKLKTITQTRHLKAWHDHSEINC